MIKTPTKLLTPTAKLPTYGSEGAAGMDLYADEDVTIRAGEHALVKTGVAMAIHSAYYGRVAPRSGLAYKHGIDVLAGVIDCDYRGEIGVILMNNGYTAFEVTKGDRIAQLILEHYARADLETVEELPDTNRGEGGFGSTGQR